MNRRLSTNITFQNETARQDTIDRLYQKTRREIIQAHAFTIHASLKPLEVDTIYENCEVISDHDLGRFRQAIPGVTTAYLEMHPEKQTYSALSDWMNDDMNDLEKARREIASWLDNPKLAAFDTETTGFYDEGHVPVTAAASTLEGISLCDITMQALDNQRKPIHITDGASRANHLTDEIIAEYPPLEKNEVAIISLESLMNDGRIFVGYNTKFDRDMMCRAIDYAFMRTSVIDHDKQDRLRNLHTYFKEPSHWLEAKDIFTRAIGLEPYPGPGKYTRLEDVARATKALTSEEKQQHGALADCQLLARIVCNIRKELDEMASKKPAPVAKTEEVQQQPESELPIETQQYITQLETSLDTLQGEYNRLEEKFNAVNDERVNLGNRVRELENLCEQYQQADGIRHHEARELTWCDLEINGFRFNWTIREGEPVEAAVESAFKTVRALQAIRDTEKVRTFRVGLRDNWQPLKGFEKPANGQKPADDTDDVDHRAARGLPPADEKPATPKNTPPAANKPNTPPPAKPATPPQQPNNPPQGKTTGEKKQQLCDRIVRHQIDGQNTYDLPFTLSNGKPADRPFAPSKKDTGALEKTLLAAGYDLNSFELGTEYDLPILVEWTVGNQIPKSEPPKFYRDNMTFTIQSTEPF